MKRCKGKEGEERHWEEEEKKNGKRKQKSILC